MAEEVVEDYKSSLAELTFNSKPHINMLTMLADDSKEHADEVVQVIEQHLQKAKVAILLPVLYLIDSIIKNVRDSDYVQAFSKNIVNDFSYVFEKVDEKTRQSMFKLRQTWASIFPNSKMYALDLKVQSLDPAWPITATPEVTTPKIHVNPKFLIKNTSEDADLAAQEEEDEKQREEERRRAEERLRTQRQAEEEKARAEQERQAQLVQQQLMAKQQELLRLQQQRLELELAEAKKKLELQTREFQRKEELIKQEAEAKLKAAESRSATPPDPRVRDPRLARRDPRSGAKALDAPPVAAVAPTQGLLPTPVDHRKAATSSAMDATIEATLALQDEERQREEEEEKRLKEEEAKKILERARKEREKEEKLKAQKAKEESKRKEKEMREREREREEKTRKEREREKEENTRKEREAKLAKERAEEKRSDRKRSSKDKDSTGSSVPETKKTRGATSRDGGRRSGRRSPSREDRSSPILESKEKSPELPPRRSARLRGPERKHASPTKEQSHHSHRSRSRSPHSRSPRSSRSRGNEHSRDSSKDRDESRHSSSRRSSRRDKDSTSHGEDRKPRMEEEQHSSTGEDEKVEPPLKRPRMDELDKKKMPDDMALLFGTEDQDYRKLPPIPKRTRESGEEREMRSVLPSPTHSQPPAQSPSHEGWARFKASHPEEFPYSMPKLDLHIPSHDAQLTSPMTSPVLAISPDAASINIPKAFKLNSAESIMKEAKEQLNSGKLSHAQHQQLLQQLAQLYSLQKLKEQIRTGQTTPPDAGARKSPGLPSPVSPNTSMPPMAPPMRPPLQPAALRDPRLTRSSAASRQPGTAGPPTRMPVPGGPPGPPPGGPRLAGPPDHSTRPRQPGLLRPPKPTGPPPGVQLRPPKPTAPPPGVRPPKPTAPPPGENPPDYPADHPQYRSPTGGERPLIRPPFQGPPSDSLPPDHPSFRGPLREDHPVNRPQYRGPQQHSPNSMPESRGPPPGVRPLLPRPGLLQTPDQEPDPRGRPRSPPNLRGRPRKALLPDPEGPPLNQRDGRRLSPDRDHGKQEFREARGPPEDLDPRRSRDSLEHRGPLEPRAPPRKTLLPDPDVPRDLRGSSGDPRDPDLRDHRDNRGLLPDPWDPRDGPPRELHGRPGPRDPRDGPTGEHPVHPGPRDPRDGPPGELHGRPGPRDPRDGPPGELHGRPGPRDPRDGPPGELHGRPGPRDPRDGPPGEFHGRPGPRDPRDGPPGEHHGRPGPRDPRDGPHGEHGRPGTRDPRDGPRDGPPVELHGRPGPRDPRDGPPGEHHGRPGPRDPRDGPPGELHGGPGPRDPRDGPPGEHHGRPGPRDGPPGEHHGRPGPRDPRDGPPGEHHGRPGPRDPRDGPPRELHGRPVPRDPRDGPFDPRDGRIPPRDPPFDFEPRRPGHREGPSEPRDRRGPSQEDEGPEYCAPRGHSPLEDRRPPQRDFSRERELAPDNQRRSPEYTPGHNNREDSKAGAPDRRDRQSPPCHDIPMKDEEIGRQPRRGLLPDPIDIPRRPVERVLEASEEDGRDTPPDERPRRGLLPPPTNSGKVLPSTLASTIQENKRKCRQWIMKAGEVKLPYSQDEFYVPQHDPRWFNYQKSGPEVLHELIIDNRGFELPLGGPTRKILLDGKSLRIQALSRSREILIDGHSVYKIGNPVVEVNVTDTSHHLYYHGPMKKMWVDGFMFEVQADAPPLRVIIASEEHWVRIDDLAGDVIFDEVIVCKYGCPARKIKIGNQDHDIQFIPPPRQILIDGKLCGLDFRGDFPFVVIRNKAHGIRFDGPPREIIINQNKFVVPMNCSRKANFGNNRPHILAFGGPGHEVIIDGKWYEVKFGGPPKEVQVGLRMISLQLVGPPPDVKILGEMVNLPSKVEELTQGMDINPLYAVLPNIKGLLENDVVRHEPPPVEMPELPPPVLERQEPDSKANDERKSIPPLMPVLTKEVTKSRETDIPYKGAVMMNARQPRQPPKLVQEDRRRVILSEHSGPPDANGPNDRPGPDQRLQGPKFTRREPNERLPPFSAQGPNPNMAGPVRNMQGPNVNMQGPNRNMPRMQGPNQGPNQGFMGPTRLLGPNQNMLGPNLNMLGPNRNMPGPNRNMPGPNQNMNIPGPNQDMPGPNRNMPNPNMPGTDPAMGLNPTALLQSLTALARGPLNPDIINQASKTLPPAIGNILQSSMQQGLPPGNRAMMGQPGNTRGPPGNRPPLPGQHGGHMGPPRPGMGMMRPPAGHMAGPPRPRFGGPPMPPQQQALPSQVDVDSLLNSLIAKGIIKNNEDTSVGSPQPPPKQEEDAVFDDAGNPVLPAGTLVVRPGGKQEEDKEKFDDIPIITDFNMDNMKKQYNGVIQRIYSGVQCSSCGLRFIAYQVERYREHLDWHFRQNRKEKDGVKVAKYRRWYYSMGDWVRFEEFSSLEEQAQSSFFEKQLEVSQQAPSGTTANKITAGEKNSCPVASGNPDDDICEICGDPFEQYWDEDEEEWHLKDAVRINGITYHPLCYQDLKETSMIESSLLETPSPNYEPLTHPLSDISMADVKVEPEVQDEPEDATLAPTTSTEVKMEVSPAPVEVKMEPTSNPGTPTLDAFARHQLADAGSPLIPATPKEPVPMTATTVKTEEPLVSDTAVEQDLEPAVVKVEPMDASEVSPAISRPLPVLHAESTNVPEDSSSILTSTPAAKASPIPVLMGSPARKVFSPQLDAAHVSPPYSTPPLTGGHSTPPLSATPPPSDGSSVCSQDDTPLVPSMSPAASGSRSPTQEAPREPYLMKGVQSIKVLSQVKREFF